MSKKQNPQLIQDINKRKVTISKRKRSAIKKLMELSMLCGLDIFMVIFDRDKQKLVNFNSDPDFDHHVISHLLDKVNVQQFHHSKPITNEEYQNFIGYDQREKKEEWSESDSDDDSKQKKSGHRKRERKNYNKE